MKLKFIYSLAVVFLLLMNACDDKIEQFEIVGYTGVPASIETKTVQSESLPGQIKLKWQAPTGEFAYLQIKYYDPLQKKDVYKIASKGTTEMLISNTRARYGAYKFYFQTFNSAKEGGDINMVEATSGAAPSVTTVAEKTKIALTETQLSTNAQEPTEGPIKNLIDGNSGTFFHTRWSSPQISLPQYVQINFNEAHENFLIYYMNRNNSGTAARPGSVELQISNDGQNWETVTTLSGLPTAVSSEYTSSYVAPGKKFTYFRFNVIVTTGNTKYFNMAEFAIYDVKLNVFNPETDEKD